MQNTGPDYNKVSFVSERGMTLIDVSILTIIFSLLFLGLLQQMKLDQRRVFDVSYAADLEEITDAINHHLMMNAELPLPADPTLDISDPDFGVPVAAGPPLSECNLTGAATDGVICRPGSRDTNIDGDGTVANHYGEQVFIGALPVTALGLLPEDGLDAYGNKYTYAVTVASTDASTVGDDRGVIRMVSSQERTEDAFETFRDVHYVVVSHGQNGEGAYLRNGDRPNSCLSIREQQQIAANPDDPPETYIQAENENCDDDGVFAVVTTGDDSVAVNAQVLPDSFYLGDGGDYVDDLVRYEQSLFGDFWTSRGQSDGTVDVFMTSGEDGVSKVGINTGLDELFGQLNVDGDVLTEKLVTTRLCNNERNMCFTVDNVVNAEPASDSNLKCYTRGVKAVFLSGGNVNNYQATKTCDIDTHVTASYDLGTEDVDGTICPNGASGLNSEGKLRCK